VQKYIFLALDLSKRGLTREMEKGPQNDYKVSLSIRRKTPKNESSEEVLLYAQYKMFVDVLQDEMHMKYDLRPRKRVVNPDNQLQPKNVSSSISLDKVKELNNTIKTKEVGESLKTRN
jgi:hypothetical protein